MIFELANIQKKQNKATLKQTKKKTGGTKIVVLPQNTSPQANLVNISEMDRLKKSLGM